jgi:hypothetical protein
MIKIMDNNVGIDKEIGRIEVPIEVLLQTDESGYITLPIFKV